MSVIKPRFITDTPFLSFVDSEAFDEIYRAYFAPLCYFARRFVGNENAEDVVNSLFLKLWGHDREFETTKHLQSFLYLSTKNACLDFLKMSERAKNRMENHRVSADFIEENYEQEMIRAEYWGEIYRAIQKLPSQCANIIQLSFLDGLTNDEISNHLKLSPQTVKNQKVKGLKALRESLSHMTSHCLVYYFLLDLLK